MIFVRWVVKDVQHLRKDGYVCQGQSRDTGQHTDTSM